MKKKISIFNGVVICGLTILTFFYAFSFNGIQNSDQSNNPSQIVEKFFELSLNSDYAEIKKNYTTYTPQAYHDAQEKWLELYRKSKGIPPVEKVVEDETNDPNVLWGEIVPPASAKEPSVTISERVPDGIKKFNLYIFEIENVWIKGDEARVRVVTKSKNSEIYRGVADYLLYKVDGKWKIFMEDMPPEIAVYGMPDN